MKIKNQIINLINLKKQVQNKKLYRFILIYLNFFIRTMKKFIFRLFEN